MFKLIVGLLAASNSKNPSVRDAAEDIGESFSTGFLILGGCMLLAIFVGFPAFGIYGAIQLLQGNLEVAQDGLEGGVIGALLTYLVGGGLLYNVAVELIAPTPWERNPENWSDSCWRKRSITVCLGTLAYVALIATCVVLVVLTFMNMEVNPILSGVLFIVLQVVGLISITLGVVGKLFFG